MEEDTILAGNVLKTKMIWTIVLFGKREAAEWTVEGKYIRVSI
jgi:hypothetical protein